VPFGLGSRICDSAEANSLRRVFGSALQRIPLTPVKALTGNCCAGAGALDLCVATAAMSNQTLPAVINCDQPLEGLLAATTPSHTSKLEHALIVGTGMGGQNAALVIKKFTM